MNIIKPYNHEDKSLPTLFLSSHENGYLVINSSEFCENPEKGIFGLKGANEQVIKILPCTENISDDFLMNYNSDMHSLRGKEYCASWRRMCQPYAIWGFYPKYRNYFPTESTRIYQLNIQNLETVYYWTDTNTLVIQKVQAFKTLEQFLEKNPVCL